MSEREERMCLRLHNRRHHHFRQTNRLTSANGVGGPMKVDEEFLVKDLERLLSSA